MAVIVNGVRIEHQNAILVEKEETKELVKKVKKPVERGKKK